MESALEYDDLIMDEATVLDTYAEFYAPISEQTYALITQADEWSSFMRAVNNLVNRLANSQYGQDAWDFQVAQD
ncbi:MAG: hypothetical protein LBH87_00135, partial [Coriobacteriales bacterium]|nr:hypothetical protein [Coriobacteriales bacterium]